MFNKKFGIIALILCIILTVGYLVINTGAVSTVLLAIEGAITDGNLVKFSGTKGLGEDTGVATETILTTDSDAKIPTSKAINDFCEVTKGYLTTESDPKVDTQGEIEAILTYGLDDTAGDGDANKLWSADKIYDQLALHYLKTEMDDFSELQAIIADKTLINEEDAIILDNDLVFEGSTANEFETTFTITDPTADRTITVPDSDQTIGTATSIQDNLILKADLAEEDWGDVNITVGNVAEVQDLTIANEAQGDILYFNGTNWVRLAKGTAGQVLTMNTAGTAPEWQTP